MNRPRSATILLVEDEVPIRRFLRPAIVSQGYHLLEAESFAQGLVRSSTESPDVLIVDLGLPDGDGLDLIRRVREWSSMPVLVLSARDRERDKVQALDTGADDYLSKPFSVPELLARLRVALRHRARIETEGAPASFTVGELSLDLARRRVTLADRPLALTPIEFKLLATIARRPGRVFTHRTLLHEVWGPNRDEPHIVRVHMANLRRKIEPETARPRYLLTEPGVGYKLADE